MGAGKSNGGGGVGGGASENGNGVALPSPCSDRQRFYVELRPGETTIVSWKRLIKEAKSCPPPLVQPSSTDVSEDCHDSRFSLVYQEKQSMAKHLLSVSAENSMNVNRAKVNSTSQPKKRRKSAVKAPGEIIKDYESDKIMPMKARMNLAAGDSLCVDNLSSQPHVKAIGGLQISHVALQSPSGSPVIISENAHSAMSKLAGSASPKYLKEMDNYMGRSKRCQASGSSEREKRMVVCALSKSNREKGSSKQSNPPAKRLVPSASDRKFYNKLCRNTSIELPDLNTPVSPVDPGFSDITCRVSQDAIVAAPKLRQSPCTDPVKK